MNPVPPGLQQKLKLKQKLKRRLFRTPDFWGPGRGGVRAALLTPPAMLYDLVARGRRCLTRPVRAPVPVICVGSPLVGGSGKTPTAIAIARRLIGTGLRIHFLTRGYGGSMRGPVRVDPLYHDAHAVGDEALLLCQTAPVWVSADRPAGAQAAAAQGAEVIVMDDGFQNTALAADTAVLVIDGAYGFGNGRLLPAGPLRESPGRALARADGVILIGADATGVRRHLPPNMPVTQATARLHPDGDGRRVVAFAGIGRPEKFFAALRSHGWTVVASHGFPDHHVFDRAEVEAILDQAAGADAVACCTAKDMMRCPAALRQRILAPELEIRFDDPRFFDGFFGRRGEGGAA